jgi:hypothetical protein
VSHRIFPGQNSFCVTRIQTVELAATEGNVPRSEVFKEVTTNSAVFRDVTPCCLVEIYQYFVWRTTSILRVGGSGIGRDCREYGGRAFLLNVGSFHQTARPDVTEDSGHDFEVRKALAQAVKDRKMQIPLAVAFCCRTLSAEARVRSQLCMRFVVDKVALGHVYCLAASVVRC